MPNTYTLEQVEQAKEYFRLQASLVRSDGYTPVPPHGLILVSALEAANQERDEEQKAHDAIASLCFKAGAETPDGTSIGAVKNLADKLNRLTAYISALEKAGDEMKNHCRSMLSIPATCAWDAARDALKAQVAELEARLQGAGWISVKERLPEKETESCSVDCIICEEDGYQTLAYRYYGKLNEDNDNVWYDRVCRRNITGTVTHWMPLPEPPAIVGKKEGV